MLAELDCSLANLYNRVLETTPKGEQKLLKAEQRGWVKGREDCCKGDNLREGVATEYRARINELKDL